MTSLIEQFVQLDRVYVARFGHGPGREAFETMRLDAMVAAMELALETGQAVPGWGPGLESSIVMDHLDPAAAPDSACLTESGVLDTLRKLSELAAAYEARFGFAPADDAIEFVTSDQIIADMTRAIDTGIPVPYLFPPLDSIAAAMRKRVDDGESGF